MTKKKRKTHKQTMHDNADTIIESIENGASYDDIKRKYGVKSEDIADFIHRSDFSARAIEAMKNSAQRYANLALESLLAIKSGDDKADITRQRELAHHYRWLAKVKSPREFNENRVEKENNAMTIVINDKSATIVNDK